MPIKVRYLSAIRIRIEEITKEVIKLRMDYIIRETNLLIEKFGTRNPEELCNCLGIYIHYMDLQRKLKGFYFYQSRMHNIVIDQNVISIYRRVLLAHELGHFKLHKEIATLKGFHEHEVLDAQELEPTEYEANLFAAELLIDDEQVLDLLKYHTFFETAKILSVPAALLDLKLALLHAKGHGLDMYNISRSDFLKYDHDAYNEHQDQYFE